MYEILKLNEISKVAGTVFNDNYSLVKESAKPDGIVLRSFNMHEYDIPESVLCVGRAGAGVNNIPLDKCAEKGIVVLTPPGLTPTRLKSSLCAVSSSPEEMLWTVSTGLLPSRARARK